MSPFKIFLKLNLQYITDFENPKNQKGHVISDSFLKIIHKNRIFDVTVIAGRYTQHQRRENYPAQRY